jgi:hypothetical protein
MTDSIANDLRILFDERFYLAKYPDVACSELAPLDHYLEFGALEERDPHPLFCARFYLDQCPEVRANGDNPLLHFLATGAAAGLSPCPLFDMSWYIEHHKQCHMTYGNPLLHYLKSGASCGCDPNPLFDTSYYVEHHPEVISENVNPLVHYLLEGAGLGFDPSSEFEASSYKKHSPDVVRAGVNPLWHFLQYGKEEGRAPRNALLNAIAGSIASCYETLRNIEPRLPLLAELPYLAVSHSPRSRPAGRSYFKIADSLDRPFSRLIVVGQAHCRPPQCLKMISDLCTEYGADSFVVITEDANIVPLVDVRVVAFERLGEQLTLVDQVLILLRLIMQTGPAQVYNLGSIACAALFRHYRLELEKYTTLIPELSEREQIESRLTCLSGYSDLRPTRCVEGSPNAEGEGSKALESEAIDISVIVYCQEAGDRSVATLHSVELAIEHARSTGALSVEMLILDDVYRSSLNDEPKPPYVRSIVTGAGESGVARNSGVRSSRGKFVAFISQGDLMSTNWLSACHRFALSNADSRIVLHPLVEIKFGADVGLYQSFNSDDPDFSRAGLMTDLIWGPSFAAREIFVEHPFNSDSGKGIGYEDIQFNCDTIFANIVHKLVPDTFFCRRVSPRVKFRERSPLTKCLPGPHNLFSVAFQRNSSAS